TAYTQVRERCRPGSARDFSGDAGMFIRRVGGTFMPCFCIFFNEIRRLSSLYIFGWDVAISSKSEQNKSRKSIIEIRLKILKY
ncbi:hypothetical protein, partial [Xylanibacter rodentium]|uniref:hypothetical protein n=1 Tax=Xylanibacter rodentium TaxID=2736289 RepID=UPI00258F4933